MLLNHIEALFKRHKETTLSSRYITNNHISPLLDKLNAKWSIEVLGQSVLKKPISGIKLGCGPKRILMWSQMHGNESTTTKALFDLLNTLNANDSDLSYILEACTLFIIPILSPDGAETYTRVNANQVDLNRDAQNLTQPESKVLRVVFNQFKPHYCFNLHGQRTIFSAGQFKKPAIISFLSPAQDKACSLTTNRKIAMEVISMMNRNLQLIIPAQVGVYDDAFNINCVGDTFQNEGIPTILFEAGHYPEDYDREITRKLIYISYLTALDYISKNQLDGSHYKAYYDIPENDKLFLDIIFRSVKTATGLQDIGVQYQEVLKGGVVHFIPKVIKIEDEISLFGHREIEAKGLPVLDINGKLIKIDSENVFVLLDNEKISLLPK